MENQNIPIEAKEIRGINARIIGVVIACTVTLVGTIEASYFNLKADINNLSKAKDTDKLIYDMKLQVVNSELQLMRGDMNGVKQDLNEIKSNTKPKN